MIDNTNLKSLGGGEINITSSFYNDYVIPAGAAFFSLLYNSNPNYEYKIYVISGEKISEENQKLLSETIAPFKNASINFINIENKFKKLFENTKSKGHYSEEIYYKLILTSVFPKLDKILVTDVDVVFLKDISELYNSFKIEDDYYISAARGIFKKETNPVGTKNFISKLEETYTQEEKQKINWAGGFYIFNLKKMREDNIEDKLLNFAQENSSRLMQPEQDTLNIICYPKIKTMPPNALVCSYAYDMFTKEEDYELDSNFNKEEVIFALNNPIQLHYATSHKPWNYNCGKNKIWFEYLIKTPMFEIFTSKLFEKNRYKRVLSFKFPFHDKTFTLIKK